MMAIADFTEVFVSVPTAAATEANAAQQSEQDFAALLAASYNFTPPTAPVPVEVCPAPSLTSDASVIHAEAMAVASTAIEWRSAKEMGAVTEAPLPVAEAFSEGPTTALQAKAQTVALDSPSALPLALIDEPQRNSLPAPPFHSVAVLSGEAQPATETPARQSTNSVTARESLPDTVAQRFADTAQPPRQTPRTDAVNTVATAETNQEWNRLPSVQVASRKPQTEVRPTSGGADLQPSLSNVGAAEPPENMPRLQPPRAVHDHNRQDAVLSHAAPAPAATVPVQASTRLPVDDLRTAVAASLVAAEAPNQESGAVAMTPVAAPVVVSSEQIVFDRDFVTTLPAATTVVLPAAATAVPRALPIQSPLHALPFFGIETVRVAATVIKSLAVESKPEVDVSAPSFSFAASTPSVAAAPVTVSAAPTTNVVNTPGTALESQLLVAASTAPTTNVVTPSELPEPPAAPVSAAPSKAVVQMSEERNVELSVRAVAQAVEMGKEEYATSEVVPRPARAQVIAPALESRTVQAARSALSPRDAVVPQERLAPARESFFVRTDNSASLTTKAEPLTTRMLSHAAAVREWAEAAPQTEAETAPAVLPVNTTSNAATAETITRADAPPVLRQTVPAVLELAHATPTRETRALRLSLQPEELGRVEIEITRAADGRVSASLAAEQFDAAATLTHSLGHLRESLEQAGLVIERLEVVTTPQPQTNTNGQQHSQAQPQPSDPAVQVRQHPGEDSPAAEEEEKLLNLRA